MLETHDAPLLTHEQHNQNQQNQQNHDYPLAQISPPYSDHLQSHSHNVQIQQGQNHLQQRFQPSPQLNSQQNSGILQPHHHHNHQDLAVAASLANIVPSQLPHNNTYVATQPRYQLSHQYPQTSSAPSSSPLSAQYQPVVELESSQSADYISVNPPQFPSSPHNNTVSLAMRPHQYPGATPNGMVGSNGASAPRNQVLMPSSAAGADPSLAAQRYSPMETLSPTSSYVPKTVSSPNGPNLTPTGMGSMAPQFAGQRASPSRPEYAQQQQQQQPPYQNSYPIGHGHPHNMAGGANPGPSAVQQRPSMSASNSSSGSPHLTTSPQHQMQSQHQQPPPNGATMSYDAYGHPNHNGHAGHPQGIAHMDYNDPKSPRRIIPQNMTVGGTSPQTQPMPLQQQQQQQQPQQVPSPSKAPSMQPLPEFKTIRSQGDLRPKVSQQPPFRRANPEGGFISPLQALTVHLPSTYRICNPNFKYESSRNPRRVLTKPSKGVKNDGYDNEDSDYILYVNDILGSEEAGHKNRYLILDVLGQGTFGQVVKCQNLKTQEVVAVKVIKNRTAYFNQSMMEVSVLDLLNQKLDKNDDHHLLRLKDTFIHRQHLCLVFELLSVNLYELIKQNQFRGLSTTLVRVFAQQLLDGLTLLNKARLIHCDLKPENILLKNLESPIIKIIDFGSACDERQTVYTYIQSRFYRSPEVLLGVKYSSAIDMWSLGCIVVELFLGLPLFPGSSEYNQVSRIVEMLGNPPNYMIESGKQGGDFFEKHQDEYGRRTYKLKSMDQYSREHNTKEQPSKKYFSASSLPEIIKTYPMPRKNMKQSEMDREMNNRIAFIDFVRGLLNINPLERWTPQQAKLHPFITQQKFTGPFVPPMNLKPNPLNRSLAPGTSQQMAAEQASKQRAQAAQGAYQNSVQTATQQQQYMQPQSGAMAQQQPVYNNGYPATSQAPVGVSAAVNPPYPQGAAPQPGQPGQPGQQYVQMPAGNYNAAPASVPQQLPAQYANQPPASAAGMYAAAQSRARPRASTIEQQNGIPAAIQRVASHLDPTQPIRLQPSPAYYPPGAETGLGGTEGAASRRRTGNRQQGAARGNRDFIRTLEERTEDGGYMNNASAWR